MKDFYNECLQREKEKQGPNELDWDLDLESILKQYEQILNRLFKGTEYRAERNSTFGEKDVDIFKGEDTRRIGHLWPKKREQVIHVNFTQEICERLKDKIELPEDSDVKPGRYLKWRAFRNVDFDTAKKIVEEVAKLD